MPIMFWIAILAMPTTWLVHLKRFLHDLQKPPVHYSYVIFDGCGTRPLYEAVLQVKEVFMSSMSKPPGKPILAKPSLPTLHFQLDNCAKDNKCRYIFCFWSLLIAKNILKEVFVSFLMVGHTHNHIDGSFSNWSMKLHEENFSTIPFFMKSYMDLDNVSVILHLIEQIPNLNAFIKPHMSLWGIPETPRAQGRPRSNTRDLWRCCWEGPSVPSMREGPGRWECLLPTETRKHEGKAISYA